MGQYDALRYFAVAAGVGFPVAFITRLVGSRRESVRATLILSAGSALGVGVLFAALEFFEARPWLGAAVGVVLMRVIDMPCEWWADRLQKKADADHHENSGTSGTGSDF